MKKLLLATAVAALSVSAQAAPTVYGKAFLSVDYIDNENGKATSLTSNTSRIGLKGSEALTANTDVVYQLEYRVDVDQRGARNFESRDTYLGLANKQYGTLLAGRLTAIDAHVDFANVTNGNIVGRSGDLPLTAFTNKRIDNAFAYISPNYNGVTFLGMYGIDSSDDGAADGLSDGGWGVGAKYTPAGQAFRAGASYIQSGDLKAARVSGAFDVSPALTVGALYQNTKGLAGGSQKENLLTVSGEMKTATPWTAYAQGDFVKNLNGSNSSTNDQTRVTVGGKYAFNKAATGHVYASALDPKSGDTQYGVGTGLEYKF